MNTQPVYQNNEHARLLAQDPNQEQKQSQQNTTNSISMKKVIYGLGVVALACSGSFVAGRSAAEYKLSSASSQVMLGSEPRLGASKTNGSESSNVAIVEKAAGKKSSKKMKAKSESKEVEENDEPTDVDELTPEEMKEEIKQLRGYMQTLVGDEKPPKESSKHHHSKKADPAPVEEEAAAAVEEAAAAVEEEETSKSKKHSKKIAKTEEPEAEAVEETMPEEETMPVAEEEAAAAEEMTEEANAAAEEEATEAVPEEEEAVVPEEEAEAVPEEGEAETPATSKKSKKSSKKKVEEEAQPAPVQEIDPIKDAQDKIAAAEQAKVDLKATELEMKTKDAQKKEAAKAYNHALEDVKKAEAAEEKAAAAHKKVIENPRHTQAAVKALMQVMSETRAAADQARATSLELLQKRDSIEADWHNSWNEHERLVVYSAALQEIAKNAMRDNLGEFSGAYRR
jgi:hypothetical protein